MKILRRYIIGVLLFLPLIANADDVGIYNLTSHWGYLSLNGGAFMLSDRAQEVTAAPRFSFGVSGGYEYRYSAFWVSAGLELQYWSSNMKTATSYKYDQQLYDTQGKIMNYHYLIDPSDEIPQGLSLNLPVLVGFHVKGFFMGAGAKIGANLYSWAKVTRSYQTYATYPQYIADFEDMPGHYYSDYKLSQNGKIIMQWPISAIAEIGYDVFANISADYTKRYRLKIGLYAEYGLTNIWKNKSENPVFSINNEHPTQLVFNPYYNSYRATEQSKVIPLSAGLKVTLMFRIPTKDCNCL